MVVVRDRVVVVRDRVVVVRVDYAASTLRWRERVIRGRRIGDMFRSRYYVFSTAGSRRIVRYTARGKC